MKIVYINPNATRAMTDGIVATARAALPGAEITGMTNADGPAAIEGAADGDAADHGADGAASEEARCSAAGAERNSARGRGRLCLRQHGRALRAL